MQSYKDFGKLIAELIVHSASIKNVTSKLDIIDLIYKRALEESSDLETKKIIGTIYNLLDLYCDAAQHNFNEIGNNYSLKDAENDLNYAKDVLLTGEVSELSSNKQFIKRIANLV